MRSQNYIARLSLCERWHTERSFFGPFERRYPTFFKHTVYTLRNLTINGHCPSTDQVTTMIDSQLTLRSLTLENAHLHLESWDLARYQYSCPFWLLFDALRRRHLRDRRQEHPLEINLLEVGKLGWEGTLTLTSAEWSIWCNSQPLCFRPDASFLTSKLKSLTFPPSIHTVVASDSLDFFEQIRLPVGTLRFVGMGAGFAALESAGMRRLWQARHFGEWGRVVNGIFAHVEKRYIVFAPPGWELPDERVYNVRDVAFDRSIVRVSP